MWETWVRSPARKIPWRRKWQPTPVNLPGKFHGWRSLVGYSLWDHKESDMTEQLHWVEILWVPRFLIFRWFWNISNASETDLKKIFQVGFVWAKLYWWLKENSRQSVLNMSSLDDCSESQGFGSHLYANDLPNLHCYLWFLQWTPKKLSCKRRKRYKGSDSTRGY